MKVVLVSQEEYREVYERQPLVPLFSTMLAEAGYTNLVEDDIAYVPWSDASAFGQPWERDTDMTPQQFLTYWNATTQREVDKWPKDR